MQLLLVLDMRRKWISIKDTTKRRRTIDEIWLRVNTSSQHHTEHDSSVWTGFTPSFISLHGGCFQLSWWGGLCNVQRWWRLKHAHTFINGPRGASIRSPQWRRPASSEERIQFWWQGVCWWLPWQPEVRRGPVFERSCAGGAWSLWGSSSEAGQQTEVS